MGIVEAAVHVQAVFIGLLVDPAQPQAGPGVPGVGIVGRALAFQYTPEVSVQDTHSGAGLVVHAVVQVSAQQQAHAAIVLGAVASGAVLQMAGVVAFAIFCKRE